MLRLGFPEGTDGGELGYDFARPETGGLDIRDRILRDALLLVVHVENGRAIARAHVVALTVARGGIMNLEERFQQRPVADQLRIESDLDRLRMRAVMVVGRVWDIAAAIADAGCEDARHFTDQILHAPKAAAGENRALRWRCHGVCLSSGVIVVQHASLYAHSQYRVGKFGASGFPSLRRTASCCAHRAQAISPWVYPRSATAWAGGGLMVWGRLCAIQFDEDTARTILPGQISGNHNREIGAPQHDPNTRAAHQNVSSNNPHSLTLLRFCRDLDGFPPSPAPSGSDVAGEINQSTGQVGIGRHKVRRGCEFAYFQYPCRELLFAARPRSDHILQKPSPTVSGAAVSIRDARDDSGLACGLCPSCGGAEASTSL
jgi:hypothetical protein